MMTFSPAEVRRNKEFKRETVVVITQVENKHESRNRKASSRITRKSRREDVSRRRSANTSAVSGHYKSLAISISVVNSQTSLNMAICLVSALVWVRGCNLQVQNIWPIRSPSSIENTTKMTKRCRLRSMGPIRMMVRRMERRANLSWWIRNGYYCLTEEYMTTHQTVE